MSLEEQRQIARFKKLAIDRQKELGQIQSKYDKLLNQHNKLLKQLKKAEEKKINVSKRDAENREKLQKIEQAIKFALGDSALSKVKFYLEHNM